MDISRNNVDLARIIGGITTDGAASELFERRLDAVQLQTIQKIRNEDVRIKIANAIALCDPDAVFVNTGSEEDVQWIREHALEKGEEKALPMPRHTIHFDLKEEQGRIIDRTYYIVDEDEI